MRNKKILSCVENSKNGTAQQRLDEIKEKLEDMRFQYYLTVKDLDSGFFNVSTGNVDENSKEFVNLILMGFCRWCHDAFNKAIKVTIKNKKENKVILDTDLIKK